MTVKPLLTERRGCIKLQIMRMSQRPPFSDENHHSLRIPSAQNLSLEEALVGFGRFRVFRGNDMLVVYRIPNYTLAGYKKALVTLTTGQVPVASGMRDASLSARLDFSSCV